jgi:hypothetical protein
MIRDPIELAAKAIYRQFIAGGVGTCQYKRDTEGNLVKDRFGGWVKETPDEAVERRWAVMPELTRHRFRLEAAAALESAVAA